MFFKIRYDASQSILTFEVFDQQLPDVLFALGVLVLELSRLTYSQLVRYPHLPQSLSHVLIFLFEFIEFFTQTFDFVCSCSGSGTGRGVLSMLRGHGDVDTVHEIRQALLPFFIVSVLM